MRISGIIKLLEKAKQEHGDLPVDIRDHRGDEIKVKGTDAYMRISSGSRGTRILTFTETPTT